MDYSGHIVVIFLIYWIPTLLAMLRGHKKASGIFVINLFLGWTLIGWVISLAWSVID